jgi:membrane protein
MNISWFLFKGDFIRFVKRNYLKFIFAGILVVLSVVLAVRSAVKLTELNDYFENKGGALYAYLRGDGSLFSLVFVVLLEYIILLAIIFVCSYNDLSLFFSFGVVIYKSYKYVYDAVVVIRYYNVKALPFGILYLALAIIAVAALVCLISSVMNSQCRYRYGVRELSNLAVQSVPFFMIFLVLYLLQILIVCFGCIFI